MFQPIQCLSQRCAVSCSKAMYMMSIKRRNLPALLSFLSYPSANTDREQDFTDTFTHTSNHTPTDISTQTRVSTHTPASTSTGIHTHQHPQTHQSPYTSAFRRTDLHKSHDFPCEQISHHQQYQPLKTRHHGLSFRPQDRC